jgi:hypothetical protein
LYFFFSPNWEKCAEVKGDVTTGKVPDLIEGNQYEFRVRAVNKAGPGEPSDATKPHVARPKNCKSPFIFLLQEIVCLKLM